MGGRAGGGAGMGSRSGGLQRSLATAEGRIRNIDDHEEGYIMDEKGNIIDFQVGVAGSVAMKKPFSDRIFTHNHPVHGHPNPFGQSFSGPDISIAMNYNAKEFRAVTKRYTFSFKRPENGWGTKSEIARAEKVYKRIYNSTNRKDKKYLESYSGDKASARRRMGYTFAHRVNKEFAKQMGFSYTKMKIK